MFKFEMNVAQDHPVVGVRTTEGRGFTPDELAVQCAQKVVSVSDNAHPAIRDQARAFQKHIEKVVENYLNQAVRSDRTTVYNALTEAGHPDLADLIRRL